MLPKPRRLLNAEINISATRHSGLVCPEDCDVEGRKEEEKLGTLPGELLLPPLLRSHWHARGGERGFHRPFLPPRNPFLIIHSFGLARFRRICRAKNVPLSFQLSTQSLIFRGALKKIKYFFFKPFPVCSVVTSDIPFLPAETVYLGGSPERAVPRGASPKVQKTRLNSR